MDVVITVSYAITLACVAAAAALLLFPKMRSRLTPANGSMLAVFGTNATVQLLHEYRVIEGPVYFGIALILSVLMLGVSAWLLLDLTRAKKQQ